MNKLKDLEEENGWQSSDSATSRRHNERKVIVHGNKEIDQDMYKKDSMRLILNSWDCLHWELNTTAA